MADSDYKGKDKVMHFGVCFLLALYSTEGAVMTSLAKEYGDKGNPSNHWCWWDIIADGIGVVLGTIVRWFLIGSWNWL